ncbi:MAG: hypothetical protein P8X39_03855 [Desulfofustis sp.]
MFHDIVPPVIAVKLNSFRDAPKRTNTASPSWTISAIAARPDRAKQRLPMMILGDLEKFKIKARMEIFPQAYS